VSERQGQRASRFGAEIEASVRSAALAFRADDVDASVSAVIRMWWTNHLRGRRFAQLVREAYEITQARISLGSVERGEAGHRQAMPYFMAVLQDLVAKERQPVGTSVSRSLSMHNVNRWYLLGHAMRSAMATGSSQCGHAPPGPTRLQKRWQSTQRCSPK
jgi:hypothetical protein